MKEPSVSRKATSPSGGLRFAVMCNSLEFHRWQADAITGLLSNGHKLVLLIRDARKVEHHDKHGRKSITHPRRTLFNHLQNRLFEPDARRLVNLTDELQQIDTLACHVEKSGFSEIFIPAEVQAIKTYKPDFILRFAFNIIRGEILQAAKYGVWSFHHGDEMKYRGGPAGFWEIYRGDAVTGAIMQRLTDRLDAGIILQKGYFKTVLHSFKGQQELLLSASSSWPSRVANSIAEGWFVQGEPSTTSAPIFKVPGNFRLLLFLLILFRNRLRFYYRELFCAEIWNVGLIKKPIGEVIFGSQPLRASEISWLRHFSATKYLADPMGFIEGPKLHIMVEDYSYKTRKARISEIIWNATRDSFSVPIRTIEGQDHLSYPYIIVHNKSVFCVPESYLSGSITLYKRNYSEESFIEEKVLVKGIDAIDPTLFFHEGYWWLFFTTKQHSWTHLHLYFATTLEGPYQPHRKNPVKIDICSARPAGTPFIYEGQLYRPAQDCSISYGGSVVINRVDVLTPEDYSEFPVSRLDPLKDSPYNKGLHTLSMAGGYTLIDGKRYSFNRYFFIHQLKSKIAKLRKRNG